MTTATLANGQIVTVAFPDVSNFKFLGLVHANMTGTVHVLDGSPTRPHNQDFYDVEAPLPGV